MRYGRKQSKRRGAKLGRIVRRKEQQQRGAYTSPRQTAGLCRGGRRGRGGLHNFRALPEGGPPPPARREPRGSPEVGAIRARVLRLRVRGIGRFNGGRAGQSGSDHLS